MTISPTGPGPVRTSAPRSSAAERSGAQFADQLGVALSDQQHPQTAAARRPANTDEPATPAPARPRPEAPARRPIPPTREASQTSAPEDTNAVAAPPATGPTGGADPAAATAPTAADDDQGADIGQVAPSVSPAIQSLPPASLAILAPGAPTAAATDGAVDSAAQGTAPLNAPAGPVMSQPITASGHLPLTPIVPSAPGSPEAAPASAGQQSSSGATTEATTPTALAAVLPQIASKLGDQGGDGGQVPVPVPPAPVASQSPADISPVPVSSAQSPTSALSADPGVTIAVPAAAPAALPQVVLTGATPAPGTPPGTPQHLAAQVAPHIAVLRSGADGTHTMTVQVTPEDLGTVAIQVHLKAGQVDLTLHGSSEHAKAALIEALPHLRRDLDAAGLTTNRVEVNPDTDTSSWLTQQDARGRQGEHDQQHLDRRARTWTQSGEPDEAPAVLVSPPASPSGVDVRV